MGLGGGYFGGGGKLGGAFRGAVEECGATWGCLGGAVGVIGGAVGQMEVFGGGCGGRWGGWGYWGGLGIIRGGCG